MLIIIFYKISCLNGDVNGLKTDWVFIEDIQNDPNAFGFEYENAIIHQ